MYQNPPRLEYLGDVDVRNNELEVSQGNSALFPARVLEQSFTLSCQLPSFYAEIETSYRNNYHCVMSQINREIDESGNTNFILPVRISAGFLCFMSMAILVLLLFLTNLRLLQQVAFPFLQLWKYIQTSLFFV